MIAAPPCLYPTASHIDGDGQAIEDSAVRPGGTVCDPQLAPPSLVRKTTTVEAKVGDATSPPGVSPMASQVEVVGQATAFSILPTVEGRSVATHFLPPSVV